MATNTKKSDTATSATATAEPITSAASIQLNTLSDKDLGSLLKRVCSELASRTSLTDEGLESLLAVPQEYSSDESDDASDDALPLITVTFPDGSVLEHCTVIEPRDPAIIRDQEGKFHVIGGMDTIVGGVAGNMPPHETDNGAGFNEFYEKVTNMDTKLPLRRSCEEWAAIKEKMPPYPLLS